MYRSELKNTIELGLTEMCALILVFLAEITTHPQRRGISRLKDAKMTKSPQWFKCVESFHSMYLLLRLPVS